MTPETYERVTRIPGSHALCMAGIRRLVDRDVRVRLKAMALQWNQHEIPAMRDLARRLGLPFRHDAFLNPRIDGATSLASELQLGPDDVVALDMTDAKSAEDLRRFCDKSISPGENVPPKESVFLCGAGEASFAVDPGGRLLPCLLLRKICFDLKPGEFERSWNELGACLESHAWTRPSPCRSCNLMALCASCAGAAELETGDLEGIVRQFCVITHHRAAAFLGASCGHRQDASCCLGQDDSAERADLMSSNRSMKAG
jgi:radical SAM protein with 4Fe4S-binding SPASM domain